MLKYRSAEFLLIFAQKARIFMNFYDFLLIFVSFLVIF